jgi:uncharacterized protein (TIGR02186 family)
MGRINIISIGIFCFALVLLVSGYAMAQKNLTIDLASDHVDITTGFNGSHLHLFGVKDRPGDVAVVIRGPEKEMTVRKKNRMLGVWMNTEYMSFNGVPAYYDYAISKNFGFNDAEEIMLRDNGVGLTTLVFEPEGAVPDRERVRSFQEALIRNKQMQHLFPLEAKNIEFLSDNFFRTTMYLHANVPTGEYVIETLLFRGERLIDRSATNLTVAPVGLNAQIYEFATQRSFYYGLICVFIAVFAGWAINVIRNQ